MNENDLKRVSRLTSLVVLLQTKPLITAAWLSEKFGVSIRTIYRDIRALEVAGIPVLTVEGKGYSLMEGYKIPPVMFTESEAQALVTAERLVMENRDSSFSKEFLSAIEKVKAVLQFTSKEKIEFLSNRIAVSPLMGSTQSSNSLMLIQHALTEYKVLDIHYDSLHKGESTTRLVEPFALYYCQEENWALIAFCRLRKDFRMFRLDRITDIKLTEMKFDPHKLTLREYQAAKKKNFTTPDIPLS